MDIISTHAEVPLMSLADRHAQDTTPLYEPDVLRPPRQPTRVE